MIEFLKGTVTPKDWLAISGILGVAAAIAAVFYLFVHQAKLDDLNAIQIVDTQKVADLTRARTINAQIDDLRLETAQIETLVSDFDMRLPSRREIVELLEDFQRMANSSNLKVDFSPLPRERDSRKETIPYKIVARGDFHQIAAFINRLERFKRYLKVSNLNLARTEQGTVRAEFTLNTYRFLQQD